MTHVYAGLNVSCPHCRPKESCCQCNGRGELPFDKAIASVENAWDFKGCDCGACLRLRAALKHITRLDANRLIQQATPPPATDGRSWKDAKWKRSA